MVKRIGTIALGLSLGLASGLAHATNGYFSHGYGIKAKGMAGVGIALPQDAMAAATNPAGMAWVGSRMDVGLDVFRPVREATISGNGAGLDGSYDGDRRSTFYVPEFGYNRMLGPDLAVGLVIYGNGGMNTSYRPSPFSAFGVTDRTGVDLTQVFVAPTLAWKPHADHALGISLNLAHQRFSAYGLQPFAMMSSDPARLTNNGEDSSSGWSVRVGWTGRVGDAVTLGATYQTKTRMGRFDDYAGLFPDRGEFDIPANYGVGVAVKAAPKLTVAADLQRIDYSGVPAVGDTGASMAPLGASGGPGFGWRDMTVLRVGASYAMNDTLTLRGGFSRGRQPIPSDEVFFNILAPGVIEQHLTLGATWKLGAGKELSVAYMHGLSKSVSGGLPPMVGGGEARLKMHQNSLGVAFGWQF
ncbi:MAG: TonB-dependent receptor [Burkholderiaceae bacterium]|nr:TonB-dependent receptor [Burkholderiaceae bacterium]